VFVVTLPCAVVQLGSGRCLNGIHCALLGCRRVILTDADPAVLRDAVDIRRINGLTAAQVDIQRLEWGTFDAATEQLRTGDSGAVDATGTVTAVSSRVVSGVDLLLGADVLYDPRDFDAVLATVCYFNCPLLTVYQHRGEGMRRSVHATAHASRTQLARSGVAHRVCQMATLPRASLWNLVCSLLPALFPSPCALLLLSRSVRLRELCRKWHLTLERLPPIAPTATLQRSHQLSERDSDGQQEESRSAAAATKAEAAISTQPASAFSMHHDVTLELLRFTPAP
jgi:hypothetical protein